MTNQTPESGEGWVRGYDWTGEGLQTVQCLDCRMAVSFPSGMDRHGTHRIAVPDQPSEETPSGDGLAPDAETPSVVVPVVVCSSCGETYAKAVPFCALCGASTETPDNDVVMEGLRMQVESIQSELRQTQDEYAAFKQEASAAIGALRTKTARGQQKLTWQMIDPRERWTVAWGVWWRIFAVVTLLYIVLFVSILAAAQTIA